MLPPMTDPASKWRIITPCLMIPFLLPSLVLAYACATSQGPWASDGYFGPGTSGHLIQTLLLLIPIAVWAGSWLLSWEGCAEAFEPRTITALLAGVLGVLISAAFAVLMLTAVAVEGFAQAN